jgi:hypothetical protein
LAATDEHLTSHTLGTSPYMRYYAKMLIIRPAN